MNTVIIIIIKDLAFSSVLYHKPQPCLFKTCLRPCHLINNSFIFLHSSNLSFSGSGVGILRICLLLSSVIGFWSSPYVMIFCSLLFSLAIDSAKKKKTPKTRSMKNYRIGKKADWIRNQLPFPYRSAPYKSKIAVLL